MTAIQYHVHSVNEGKIDSLHSSLMHIAGQSYKKMILFQYFPNFSTTKWHPLAFVDKTDFLLGIYIYIFMPLFSNISINYSLSHQINVHTLVKEQTFDLSERRGQKKNEVCFWVVMDMHTYI